MLFISLIDSPVRLVTVKARANMDVWAHIRLHTLHIGPTRKLEAHAILPMRIGPLRTLRSVPVVVDSAWDWAFLKYLQVFLRRVYLFLSLLMACYQYVRNALAQLANQNAKKQRMRKKYSLSLFGTNSRLRMPISSPYPAQMLLLFQNKDRCQFESSV